jgi:hypothetical protein
MFELGMRYQLVGVQAPFGFAQGDFVNVDPITYLPLVVDPRTYDNQNSSWAVVDPTVVNVTSITVALPQALKTKSAKVFQGVRLYVDPLPLILATTPEAMQGYIDQILVAVDDLTSTGMKVVIDFHIQPSPSSVPGWGISEFIDGPSGPKFTALKAAGVVMATALLPYGNNVAFELFNVPPDPSLFVSPVNPWPQQIQSYWAAVRVAAPTLSLIISGAGGTIASLVNTISPVNFDVNTAYAAHAYIPPVFSMQGVVGSDYYYIHDLPFPPSLVTDSIFIEIAKMVAASVNSVDTLTADQRAVVVAFLKGEITNYFAIPEDANWINMQLSRLTAWALARGVPANMIFVSEYGCPGNMISGDYVITGTDIQSRTNYVKAFLAVANSLGISTSLNVLSDINGGYAITDSRQTFLPEILWALHS